ncbi:hypothetical protein [Sphingomonas sanxanigenens]|uniref:Uncharacterized protein n=1 Tax=Sphingomonas sanxanigenens DSM 19645 = NX02 TaxID=1123269 RepID=W0AHV7_9SPHN|nr:hypothetical protein [Sphingomonas sanxanigenens]AHE55883.1 hypothetical protein NX02_21235 [Sphingomonas sanxanigenens DSM 19645 = NX02]
MTPAAIAQRDPIYGMIWRAVPRSVDPMLREDIMSDIYLGIREGRLHPCEIATMAKVYISAGYAAFANRWGAVSLDAAMPGTDDLRIIDTIEDPQALEAFDRIEGRYEH